MQPGRRLSPTRDCGGQVNTGIGLRPLWGWTGMYLFGVTVLFICGFVMIMIALLHFIFLVCEQLKEAEENDLSSGEVERGLGSPPLSNQHLKSERSFPPFHLEKRNLNKSHPA